MFGRVLVLCVLSVLVAWVSASAVQQGANPKTLVLLDNNAIKITHSSFFNSLTARGHELTYKQVNEENVRLEKYGEYFYDNLVLFAPTAEDFGENIKSETIIKFIDSGRSLLFAVNSNVTEPVREIANECGIDIDEDGSAVIDHINYDQSDATSHTLIAASNIIQNAPALVGSATGPKAPILFRGIGHAAAEGSRLLNRVLTGADSTYSFQPLKRVEEYPQSTGRDTLLVTALQTRNNARVLFSGSLDLFSNQFFSAPVSVPNTNTKFDKSGNDEFAAQVSRWVFHERGLLRATELTHKHVDRKEVNPSSYRINDKVEFSILIEEFDGASRSWLPYEASDVQVEFVMIDPYVRINMKSDKKGRFSASFQVPDVYGVFKYVINYGRPGYSNLEISHQVPVHPFRHNEFERFIDVAYPYYLSAFSVMAAFFIFGLLFLYQKDS